MAEINYKSLIPKFNSQEEMNNYQSVKITVSSYENEAYKLFDKNKESYVNIYKTNIIFKFKNKVNLKKIFLNADSRSIYDGRYYASFYYSNDGNDWKYICSFPNEESEKIIENDECYKYYKFNIGYPYGGHTYEVDLFTIDNTKFLIKQNNDYYSLQSNLLKLGQPQSNTELENWYEKYGVNEPNVLLKPINKDLDKSNQNDFNSYRIYDKLNFDAILTMATDKEDN